jgi:hypothetical protein
MATTATRTCGRRTADGGRRTADGGLSVWLQPTEAPKIGKNRNLPDLVVDDGNVGAEVSRLLALGASHADVGQQGDEGFTVLRDPEGNGLCILHRR